MTREGLVYIVYRVRRFINVHIDSIDRALPTSFILSLSPYRPFVTLSAMKKNTRTHTYTNSANNEFERSTYQRARGERTNPTKLFPLCEWLKGTRGTIEWRGVWWTVYTRPNETKFRKSREDDRPKCLPRLNYYMCESKEDDYSVRLKSKNFLYNFLKIFQPIKIKLLLRVSKL